MHSQEQIVLISAETCRKLRYPVNLKYSTKLKTSDIKSSFSLELSELEHTLHCSTLISMSSNSSLIESAFDVLATEVELDVCFNAA